MPYSGNPNGTFSYVLSLDVIPINKCTFLPPSIGDLGGNSPHLTPQVFEMSGGGPFTPWGQTFGVVYLNKSSGISYHVHISYHEGGRVGGREGGWE